MPDDHHQSLIAVNAPVLWPFAIILIVSGILGSVFAGTFSALNAEFLGAIGMPKDFVTFVSNKTLIRVTSLLASAVGFVITAASMG